MRFYTQAHQHYCGIDLHAKTMYVCIVNQQGDMLLHQNINTDSEQFLTLIDPYRQDLVIAVECIFTWYWLADLCAKEDIHFVLGHALYMKAIHGGKAKNDRIDSRKIALLAKGGLIPQALCLSGPHARHPGSVAPTHVPGSLSGRPDGAYPEHCQSIQSATTGIACRSQSTAATYSRSLSGSGCAANDAARYRSD